jgi:hypothetical protein
LNSAGIPPAGIAFQSLSEVTQMPQADKHILPVKRVLDDNVK